MNLPFSFASLRGVRGLCGWGSSALSLAKGLQISSKVQKHGEITADENCWQRKSRIHPDGVSALSSPVVFGLEGSGGKLCWPEWDTAGGSRQLRTWLLGRAGTWPVLPPPSCRCSRRCSGRKGSAGFGLLFSPQSQILFEMLCTVQHEVRL